MANLVIKKALHSALYVKSGQLSLGIRTYFVPCKWATVNVYQLYYKCSIQWALVNVFTCWKKKLHQFRWNRISVTWH